MNKKLYKQFLEVIKPYDVTVEQGTNHFKLIKNGVQVSVLSVNGDSNNCRQALRDLRRGGHVDDEACKIRFS